MKNKFLLLFILVCACTMFSYSSMAQCSICTRTAQQLGDKPAHNLNAGILYLAVAPLAIAGVVGYRWWRSSKALRA